MVFVILDNPANKDSVLDIRVPIFRPGKLPEIKSYMEQFPFPFYIILRDINALPLTLSDALRQWFELVSSMDWQQCEMREVQGRAKKARLLRLDSHRIRPTYYCRLRRNKFPSITFLSNRYQQALNGIIDDKRFSSIWITSGWTSCNYQYSLHWSTSLHLQATSLLSLERTGETKAPSKISTSAGSQIPSIPAVLSKTYGVFQVTRR